MHTVREFDIDEEDEEETSDLPHTSKKDFYFSHSHHGLTPVPRLSILHVQASAGSGSEVNIDGDDASQSHDDLESKVNIKQFPNEGKPSRWNFFFAEHDGVYLPQQSVIRLWQWVVNVSVVGMCLLQLLMIFFHFNGAIWWFIVYLCDVVFLLDIVLNFRLAFMNARGMLVLDKTAIRNKYLRTTFALDLVSLFPFEITVFAFKSSLAKHWAQLRANRLLRYYRPVDFMSKYNNCLYSSIYN